MKVIPRQLSEYQRGWIAGLLDSDGSISFNRASKKHKFVTGRVEVTNRSKKLIEAVLKVIGSGHISVSRVSEPSKGMLGKTYCPMYRYSGGSGVMTWLLPQLELIGKEGHRLVAIEALPLMNRNRWRTEAQSARLAELIKQMTNLNSGGHVRA